MKLNYLKATFVSTALLITGFVNVANAGLITTIDAGATNHIIVSSGSIGDGTISESGITLSATADTHYGYDDRWGLDDNGAWNNMNLIGLAATTGSFSITFDTLVSKVLAFVSYASSSRSPYPQASIGIYDINDVLLETTHLNGIQDITTLNQGWDIGFARTTAEIKTITFFNSFIVANNLRSVADAAVPSVDVPEPSTLAVFVLGMIGLASRRFNKKS